MNAASNPVAKIKQIPSAKIKPKAETRKTQKQAPIEPTPMQTNVLMAKLECQNHQIPPAQANYEWEVPITLYPPLHILCLPALLSALGCGALTAVNVPPESCINLTAHISPICSSGQLVKSSGEKRRGIELLV